MVAPSPQLAVAMGQPCVPSAQDKGALGPPRALTGMATPQDGDRILVFRPRWLNLLLDKEKYLNTRPQFVVGALLAWVSWHDLRPLLPRLANFD